MSKPLTLSVGIPTYNQAEYLEETIESLLKQTRPFDEILVSDHYSTDNTQQVLKKYAGRVKCLQPPHGVNLAGQYHFTLASQSGDWITLCSSDDVARPNFCEVLLRGAQRCRDAVLVRAGWENINRVGKVVSTEYMLSVAKITLPPQTLFEQKYGPKASFAAFAVRREAYAHAGPILETLESLADWALFLQMSPLGSFVYEDELISGYRVGHDGNKFRDRLGMWVRDEQRMFYQVIPQAAGRAGLSDLSWIDQASYHNFVRYLTAASEEYSLDERAEIVKLFSTWASRVHGESMLQDFAEGKIIPKPFNLLRKAKALLRPLAQSLYSYTRRG